MMRIRSLTVLLVVACLSISCASTPDPVLCGQIGVALGMGGGAVAGNNSQDGGAGRVIAYGGLGAVVGGVGGYLICQALEKEEEPPPPPPAPKAEPKPGPPPPQPAEPKADPCDQVIRLRGVKFDFDKAVVRPDAALVLDQAALLLQESLSQCPSRRVAVEGYTDDTGPEVYNQQLSERRAMAVREYLVGKGVNGSQLEARGFGEANPIADNKTREGRALNRRVELRMVQ